MSKLRNPDNINLIVIHCSATANGRWVNVHQIDDGHAKRKFRRAEECRQRQNPFLKAIGYHFVIYTNGAMATGRAIEETGAHAKGYNTNSIGVCMIGTDQFSKAQWQTLSANIRGLRERFPNARIVGHRDLSPDTDGDGVVEQHEWLKTCPSFDVKTWLQSVYDPMPQNILDDSHADGLNDD